MLNLYLNTAPGAFRPYETVPICSLVCAEGINENVLSEVNVANCFHSRIGVDKFTHPLDRCVYTRKILWDILNLSFSFMMCSMAC